MALGAEQAPAEQTPSQGSCIQQHPRIKQLFQLGCPRPWFEEPVTAPWPSLPFPELLVLRLKPVCAEEVAVRR